MKRKSIVELSDLDMVLVADETETVSTEENVTEENIVDETVYLFKSATHYVDFEEGKFIFSGFNDEQEYLDAKELVTKENVFDAVHISNVESDVFHFKTDNNGSKDTTDLFFIYNSKAELDVSNDLALFASFSDVVLNLSDEANVIDLYWGITSEVTINDFSTEDKLSFTNDSEENTVYTLEYDNADTYIKVNDEVAVKIVGFALTADNII